MFPLPSGIVPFPSSSTPIPPSPSFRMNPPRPAHPQIASSPSWHQIVGTLGCRSALPSPVLRERACQPATEMSSAFGDSFDAGDGPAEHPFDDVDGLLAGDPRLPSHRFDAFDLDSLRTPSEGIPSPTAAYAPPPATSLQMTTVSPDALLQYSFEGRYDLVKFLKTVKNAGLYVVLRIGPYVCAEWNFGGFPVWLKYVPGISFRTNNEPFKIENEYEAEGRSLGPAGHSYMTWDAEMAVGLKTGGSNMINTCNGFYCDNFNPNRP